MAAEEGWVDAKGFPTRGQEKRLLDAMLLAVPR